VIFSSFVIPLSGTRLKKRVCCDGNRLGFVGKPVALLLADLAVLDNSQGYTDNAMILHLDDNNKIGSSVILLSYLATKKG
jgi:hypothetical protein